MQRLKQFINYIGELRTMLIATAVLCLAHVPFVGDEVRSEGWGLFPDIIAPVVSMILVFGILLDMLMSRVFMLEKSVEERAKFSSIIKLEALTLLALIGLWSPYFYRVLA